MIPSELSNSLLAIKDGADDRPPAPLPSSSSSSSYLPSPPQSLIWAGEGGCFLPGPQTASQQLLPQQIIIATIKALSNALLPEGGPSARFLRHCHWPSC